MRKLDLWDSITLIKWNSCVSFKPITNHVQHLNHNDIWELCPHADVDAYRRNLCFLIWLETASPEWLSLWGWLIGQWDSDDDKKYCSKSKSIHNEWAGVTKKCIMISWYSSTCFNVDFLSGAGLTLFKSWPQRGELPYIQKTQGKLRPLLSQSIIQRI